MVREPLAAQVAHRLVQVRRLDGRRPERAPPFGLGLPDALEGDGDGLGELAWEGVGLGLGIGIGIGMGLGVGLGVGVGVELGMGRKRRAREGANPISTRIA